MDDLHVNLIYAGAGFLLLFLSVMRSTLSNFSNAAAA